MSRLIDALDAISPPHASGICDGKPCRRPLLRESRSSDIDALFAIQGDRQYMRLTYASPSRDACAAWLQHIGMRNASSVGAV
jgi:hypothetical protein